MTERQTQITTREEIDSLIADCRAKRAARVMAELGEPLSEMDFKLYAAALKEVGGVPNEDAKRQTRILRESYDTGNTAQKCRVASAMVQAFMGLTGRREVSEPIPVMTTPHEIVVFKKTA